MNVATTRAVSLAAGLAVASSGFIGIAAAHDKPAKLAASHLTLHATKEKLTAGGNIKASVTGKLRSHKSAVAGETVTVQERKGSGKAWTDTSSTGVTGTDGTVSFAFVQTTANEQYRLVFAGDATYKKSHSGVIAIRRSKVVAATEGS